MRSVKRFVAVVTVALLIMQSWSLIGRLPDRADAAYEPHMQPNTIAMGLDYTLFVDRNGNVWGLGYDAGKGTLGQGLNTSSYYITPVSIPSLTNIKEVVVYGHSAYAVTKDGKVKVWGENANYQLGTGSSGAVGTPQELTTISNVKQIAAGSGFAIALLNDGTLKGWGTNGNGKLLNLSGATGTPSSLTGISNVKSLSADNDSVIALLHDGTVRTWGYNVYGQLGTGNTTTQTTPFAVPQLANIIQVSIRGFHTMALRKDGTVFIWGLNHQYALGTGNTVSSYVPISVPGLNAKFIHASSNSASYALLQDNTMKVWGQNMAGKLGTGTTQSITPTAVPLDTIPVAVYSNAISTVVVGFDGKTYVSGRNTYKQLGIITPAGEDIQSFILSNTVVDEPVLLDMQLSGSSGSGIYAYNFSNFSFFMSNGVVKAWGDNADGQLGLGHKIGQKNPTVIPDLVSVKDMAVGTNFALALLDNGTVKAWGRNQYGQLGLGNTSEQTRPAMISALSGVKQIAAGDVHSLALMDNGTVKSWGVSSSGQLGPGTGIGTIATSPIDVPGLNNIVQVAAGAYFSMALTQGGEVKVWGNNTYYELGLGSGSAANQLAPVSIAGLTGVKRIFAGRTYALALMQDGGVKVWGLGYNGELGLGAVTHQYTPADIPGLANVKQIAFGNAVTHAALADGTVKSWGINSVGQLGLNNRSGVNVPTVNPYLQGVKSLAAGYAHSLALLDNGEILSWGSNGYGQLGLNSSNELFDISSMNNVKQIATGEAHSLALLADGTVRVWGDNTFGQLGLGAGVTTDQAYPRVITGLSGVKQVAAGKSHSVALLSDGTVKTWGRNAQGQLGLGAGVTGDQSSPTAVPGLIGVQQIVSGWNTVYALLEDGTVKTWGDYAYGQLGLGSGVSTFQRQPATIASLSGVVSLHAGRNHVFALFADGTVKSWGMNDHGQLGLGTGITGNQSSPVSVAGLQDVKQIAGGLSHSLAVLNDGSVKAWGLNLYGQLGLGSGTASTQRSPVVIPDLYNVKQVEAGDDASFALAMDGKIKSWGENGYGQLGHGASVTGNASSPLPVQNVGGIAQISANSRHTLVLLHDGTVKAWGNAEDGRLGHDSGTVVIKPQKIPGANGFSGTEAAPSSITISASLSGISGLPFVIDLYLDNETQPRDSQSVTLIDNEATVLFKPILHAALTRGAHTARVVAHTGDFAQETSVTLNIRKACCPIRSIRFPPPRRSVRTDKRQKAWPILPPRPIG